MVTHYSNTKREQYTATIFFTWTTTMLIPSDTDDIPGVPMMCGQKIARKRSKPDIRFLQHIHKELRAAIEGTI